MQTAEQDAYDFFTSEIGGDVLDHIPFPRHNINEVISQDLPPMETAALLEGAEQPTTLQEYVRDEGETSVLLEQQVSLQYIYV